MESVLWYHIFWQSSIQRGRHTQVCIITSLKWIIQMTKSAQTVTVGFLKLLSTHPIHIVVWGKLLIITACTRLHDSDPQNWNISLHGGRGTPPSSHRSVASLPRIMFPKYFLCISWSQKSSTPTFEDLSTPLIGTPPPPPSPTPSVGRACHLSSELHGIWNIPGGICEIALGLPVSMFDPSGSSGWGGGTGGGGGDRRAGERIF